MSELLTIGLLCIAASAPGADRSPPTSLLPPSAAAATCEGASPRPDGTRPPSPEEPTGGCPTGLDELVADLLDWIAERTDYDVAPVRAVPPAVTFADAGERLECDGGDIVVDEAFRALYERSAR